MFAVFSLIEGIPTIHKIYVSEETTKKSLSNFVISYIQGGRNDDKSPLTLPLSEIKIDTFPSYPIRTYISIDESMIEIYEHSLIDKVEKGWVWNGTMKSVVSKKIGYFQALKVSDSTIEDQTKEYKTLSSEMDDLIEEIMNEISDTRFSLEKEIEDVKNLQFDLQKLTDQEIPILLNYDEKVVSLPVLQPIDIPYLRNEYPNQPEPYCGVLSSRSKSMDIARSLRAASPVRLVPDAVAVGDSLDPKNYDQRPEDDFNKKDLKIFEEKYLPFFDDETKESSEDQEANEQEANELKEEIEWGQRCRSNHRGARRVPPGRMRKMRLRSY